MRRCVGAAGSRPLLRFEWFRAGGATRVVPQSKALSLGQETEPFITRGEMGTKSAYIPRGAGRFLTRMPASSLRAGACKIWLHSLRRRPLPYANASIFVASRRVQNLAAFHAAQADSLRECQRLRCEQARTKFGCIPCGTGRFLTRMPASSLRAGACKIWLRPPRYRPLHS